LKAERIRQDKGISLRKKEDPPGKQESRSGSDPTHNQKRAKRKKKAVKIDLYRAWCKACGICVAFCPAHVFVQEEDGYPRVAHPEACTACGRCEMHCPDFAITLREKKNQQ
jgi:2-oxoglutarate ferredoxin oxidoreductase subunit delta